MALLQTTTVLETRLRSADGILASLPMRQMSAEAVMLASDIKKVLEQGITEENLTEAKELLGKYRALTIG